MWDADAFCVRYSVVYNGKSYTEPSAASMAGRTTHRGGDRIGAHPVGPPTQASMNQG